MAAPPVSLQEALAEALPDKTDTHPAFECKVHYIHTPPKPCEPLFSPPPGQPAERTRLARHFLAVSIEKEPAEAGRSSTPDHRHQDFVLGIGIEVLIYTTARLTTLFVSKADTTGYIPAHAPSKTKPLCRAFLTWLATEHRTRHPRRQLVVSLFARAQDQYLFPGSIENPAKHVLDDRRLIRWWAQVLDPLLDLPQSDATTSNPAPTADISAHLVIPGHEPNELRSYFPKTSHALNRSWTPAHPLHELAATRIGFDPITAATLPPRCLLPRFPDDPKARFIQDLDDEVGLTSHSVSSSSSANSSSPSKRKTGAEGRSAWNSIHDLARFWEAMEFRQECASGRVVGFLWLLIAGAPSPPQDLDLNNTNDDEELTGESQDSMTSLASSSAAAASQPPPTSSPTLPSPRTITRKTLAGPIHARKPRLKGSSSSAKTSHPSSSSAVLATATNDNNQETSSTLSLPPKIYDAALHTLLHLDFASRAIAVISTSKWVKAVADSCGVREWGFVVKGRRKVVGLGSAVPGDGAGAGNAERKVNDLGSMVRRKKRKVEEG
ncbi:hypothetical protein B0A50_03544 [Salinomyces thailandicus]|uniref:histone acetyltransferase n=1 Tax=Salinomyces thailandicus TaxID=706561 RepID=A0A4U0U3C5_9PEZI|nr:hypothetical protein B0A50_03544 [Salinomyces thailandica]